MSLSGGMDLSKLKQPANQTAQSLKVPSLVAQVTEATLQTLVKVSATVPVVLEFFEATPDPVLEKVIREQSGKLMLARVSLQTEPRIAAAFRVTVAPALIALIKGQPVPIAESALSETQFLAVVNQLLAGAAAQGVQGIAVEGDVSEVIPDLPKPLQEALALVDGGEVEQAFELLTKLKAENPKDTATSALLAQVNLMKRTMNCDHEAILNSQPATFEEAFELADVLLAIGDFGSSFEILLSLYSQVQPENQERIKTRMLEYFEIGGPTNDEVRKARARFATLLY